MQAEKPQKKWSEMIFQAKSYQLAPKMTTFAVCFERRVNGLLRSSPGRTPTTKKVLRLVS